MGVLVTGLGLPCLCSVKDSNSAGNAAFPHAGLPMLNVFHNIISNLRSGLKQASGHVLNRPIEKHQNRTSEVPTFPSL